MQRNMHRELVTFTYLGVVTDKADVQISLLALVLWLKIF